MSVTVALSPVTAASKYGSARWYFVSSNSTMPSFGGLTPKISPSPTIADAKLPAAFLAADAAASPALRGSTSQVRPICGFAA